MLCCTPQRHRMKPNAADGPLSAVWLTQRPDDAEDDPGQDEHARLAGEHSRPAGEAGQQRKGESRAGPGGDADCQAPCPPRRRHGARPYFSASRAAILLSSRAMSWSKVPLASSCVNCLR